MIRAQSDFCIPVECFRTGGGVVGNFPSSFELSFFESLLEMMIAATLGGVVGGVTFRSGTVQGLGFNAHPGEAGGCPVEIELLEPKLEAAESTLGMLVLGVIGHSVSLLLLL